MATQSLDPTVTTVPAALRLQQNASPKALLCVVLKHPCGQKGERASAERVSCEGLGGTVAGAGGGGRGGGKNSGWPPWNGLESHLSGSSSPSACHPKPLSLKRGGEDPCQDHRVSRRMTSGSKRMNSQQRCDMETPRGRRVRTLCWRPVTAGKLKAKGDGVQREVPTLSLIIGS